MHDKEITKAWGFSVHEAKTLVNFDMMLSQDREGEMKQVPKCEEGLFPWCGLRFDTHTCEVLASYDRYLKYPVSEAVTVESTKPGGSLRDKMKRFMSPKCHALLLDDVINNRDTVLLNIYEMFLVCAAKTVASALRLPHGPWSNPSLISNGAQETAAYMYSLIQSRSNRRKGGFGVRKDMRCSCKVHRSEVVWLGLHAFLEILRTHRHQGFAAAFDHIELALRQAETGDKLSSGDGAKRASGDGGQTRRARGKWQGDAQSAQLRQVVQAPDALALIRTLTTGGA
ncbi:unnamed protein product [Choristocarpus tenellus]